MKTLSLLALLLALAANAPAQEAATDFRVTSAFPKYVTADIEFRDPTGAKWANFFYGKPATDAGVITLDPAKPAANFTLLCDKMAQDKGDQSRRVLGELCPPEKPHAVTLTVTSMSAPQPTVGGKEKDKASLSANMTGTLEIAGRKLPVKATATLRRHDGKGDEKNPALMLDAKFTVRATDLGLKSPGSVDVRAGLTAYPPQPGK